MFIESAYSLKWIFSQTRKKKKKRKSCIKDKIKMEKVYNQSVLF